jgi:CII-binding regulator of phage lambda lysogenization HflD
MEQAELNYYLKNIQKKLNDYFSQSMILESKIQYQNDIISQQNQTISDLDKAVEEYKEQIKNLNSKPTRKKPTTIDKTDGGTF